MRNKVVVGLIAVILSILSLIVMYVLIINCIKSVLNDYACTQMTPNERNTTEMCGEYR